MIIRIVAARFTLLMPTKRRTGKDQADQIYHRRVTGYKAGKGRFYKELARLARQNGKFAPSNLIVGLYAICDPIFWATELTLCKVRY